MSLGFTADYYDAAQLWLHVQPTTFGLPGWLVCPYRSDRGLHKKRNFYLRTRTEALALAGIVCNDNVAAPLEGRVVLIFSAFPSRQQADACPRKAAIVSRPAPRL